MTKCTVCTHREHAAIDLALAWGVSTLALSRRYKLHNDALYRHRRAHLPAQLKAKLLTARELDIDIEALREREGQSLLANLIALRTKLNMALDVALEHSDGAMISKLSGQLHTNFELVGKLLGDLAVGSHTTINNVLIMPQYLAMRVQLINALAPFPEARVAVSQVLRAIESKAAQDIQANPRELAS